MSKIKAYFLLVFLCFLSCALEAGGGCCGKIDVGPAVMQIDILDCGLKANKMTLYGVRGDAAYVLENGYCIKPFLLGGWGEGSLYNLGLGLGRCIPFGKSWIITPSVGFTWSYVSTTIDVSSFMLSNLKQKFYGYTPYVALEALWNFAECWRLSGQVQFGWSRTKTTVVDFPTCKQNTQGPNFALLLERDLNKKWSVNIGAAYNRSLSEDKSGMKAKGAKIGVAYWF